MDTILEFAVAIKRVIIFTCLTVVHEIFYTIIIFIIIIIICLFIYFFKVV